MERAVAARDKGQRDKTLLTGPGGLPLSSDHVKPKPPPVYLSPTRGSFAVLYQCPCDRCEYRHDDCDREECDSYRQWYFGGGGE